MNVLFIQMEKEGHRILKIVLSRSCREEKLDEFTYVAHDWNKVTINSFQSCEQSVTKVLHVVEILDTKFTVGGYWNLGGPGVYISQLESNRLRNTR